MKYLFSDWKRISARLKAAPRRLYLFDVDGTLAAIKNTPEAARIQKPLRRLLSELSLRPRTTVGIISGRKLDDARNMVGLEHLIYAGNHGLEVCLNGVRHVQPQARAHAGALTKIYREAKQRFASVPGALVEWKELTLSLHYRLVEKNDQEKFEETIESLAPMVHDHDFVFRRGKKIVEILPGGARNKGTIVQMLKKHLRNPATVFAGDDVTDENAFEVLNEDDVSVRVGYKKNSEAFYYLKGQAEVKRLLEKLGQV